MIKSKKLKDKQRAAIIEAKINNPDKTLRELEKETGIDHSTIWRVINKDLPVVATKSDRVVLLIDNNNNLQSLADGLIKEMLVNKDKSITVAQLTSLRESTFKQNQLLQWNATEIVDVNWSDILKKIQNWEISREQAYWIHNKVKEL